MRTLMIFLCAFLFMYIDFTFAEFSPASISGVTVYFVPRTLLIFILLLSIYAGSRMGIFLAVVFGAMLDIYIGSLYGIHTFGMVAFVVFMHTAFRVFHRDFVAMAFVVLLLIFFYDAYIYAIFSILGIIDMPMFDYAALRAVPSVLINALLFLIVFVVARKVSRVRKELLKQD
ncbi:hypothetical protein GCM10022378_04430 [Salinicoccus jeotgali]|uniref:Rod shape-determining protein MreD n=1 Tax=Salinicoccus jeotgali TaxID=381634 RepID=A0ABP7EER4_9STAP